jgi:cytoskeletal protein CcmA (bactofilin family)
MSIRSAEPTYADETETVQANSFSVIDRHSNFDGTFRSSRDLRIEGEVKGTIECQGTLFVAEGANVTAKVDAENIAVAGNLNGEIRCLGRLQILASGQVRGKVSTVTLVINEGAYYEGQLEMTPPEERAAALNAPRQIGARPAAAPGSARQAEQQSAAAASTFIRRLGGPETPWDNRQGEEGAPEEVEEPQGS